MFTFVLLLTALAIASSAAFFSTYGLAQVFSGSFIAVIIMASCLEAGKLVTASYLYRYWKVVGWFRKSYMTAAVLGLMLMTSAGIFGFLSAAHQQDMLPLEEMQAQVVQLEQQSKELTELKRERVLRRKEINKQINDLPSNYATKRQQVRLEYKPELQQIAKDITEFDEKIRMNTEEKHKLKTTVIKQEAHTGPIIYIAKVFNLSVDDATKWMIFLIMFVFDPLAVTLTIAANDVMMHNKKGKVVIDADDTTADLHPTDQPLSVDTLEKMLDTINNKKALTPEMVLQKAMLEEMLAKRRITTQMRTKKEEHQETV